MNRLRLSFGLVLASIVILTDAPAFLTTSHAQATNWFTTDFNSPGGLNRYEFPFFWGEASNGGNGAGRTGRWSFEHLANGDFDGSGAARLTVQGGLSYPADQFSWGWGVSLNRTFNVGDHVYFRWRMMFESNYRWTGASGNAQNKFISIGATCQEPCNQSRAMIMIMGDSGNNQCTIGANPSNPGVGTMPVDFGLPYGSWTEAAANGRYGGFSVHKNIGNECAGPIAVTYSGSSPIPRPAPNSTTPQQPLWYHCQAYIKSGSSNDAQFKVWCNNNNFSTPSSQRVGGFNLGVNQWGTAGVGIGGHMTDMPLQTNTYRLGAFEVGPDFDPTWFPGASAPSLPTQVVGVRITPP